MIYIQEMILQMRDLAYQEAKESVYRDANKVSDWINEGRKSGKGMAYAIDAILPFTKTPLNILNRMIEYSPVSLITSILDYHKIGTGEMTPQTYINNLSRGITGSGISAIGFFLASIGRIRTKDDDPDKVDQYKSDLGQQDYALVLPNGTTYTLDWLTPQIGPLGVGVELYKALSNKYSSFDDIFKAFTKLADPITQTSMLYNFAENLSTFKENKIEGMIINAATSYVEQFFPTLGGQINKIIFENRKTTYDSNPYMKAVRTIFNKIAGLAALNEDYVNTKGEKEKNNDLGMGVAGRAINAMFNPGYVKDDTTDKYDKEIMRLYELNPDANQNKGVIPSHYTSQTAKVNGVSKSLPFTAKESTSFNTMYAQTLRNEEKKYIDSPAYKNMSDEEHITMMNKFQTYALEIAKNSWAEGRGLPYSIDSTVTTAQKAKDYDMSLYQYYVGNSLTGIPNEAYSKSLIARQYYGNIGTFNAIQTAYQSGKLTKDDIENMGLSDKVIKYNDTQYDTKMTALKEKYSTQIDQKLSDASAGSTKTSNIVESDQDVYDNVMSGSATAYYYSNGTKIKNSEQLLNRQKYEKNGQYDRILADIQAGNSTYEDYGLNKTVVNLSEAGFNEYLKNVTNLSGKDKTSTSTKKKSSSGSSSGSGTSTKNTASTSSSISSNSDYLDYIKTLISATKKGSSSLKSSASDLNYDINKDTESNYTKLVNAHKKIKKQAEESKYS